MPLKDLIQKNHDDRVKVYLDQMRGMTIEEIISNTAQISAKRHANRSIDSVRDSKTASPNALYPSKVAEETKQTVKVIAVAETGKTKVAQ